MNFSRFDSLLRQILNLNKVKVGSTSFFPPFVGVP